MYVSDAVRREIDKLTISVSQLHYKLWSDSTNNGFVKGRQSEHIDPLALLYNYKEYSSLPPLIDLKKIDVKYEYST